MKQTNEKPRKFKGTSENGDLGEALVKAIAQGKSLLQQDFLNWELETIKGQAGGFIGKMNVTVIIKSVNGKKSLTHANNIAFMPASANLTGGNESNKSAELDPNDGDVYVIFTLDTVADWQSSMAQPLVPYKTHHMSEIRVARLASYEDLVGHPPKQWVITIVNTIAQDVTYVGSVILVQAASLDDAQSGGGTQVYEYPMDNTVKASISTKEQQLVSFFMKNA